MVGIKVLIVFISAIALFNNYLYATMPSDDLIEEQTKCSIEKRKIMEEITPLREERIKNLRPFVQETNKNSSDAQTKSSAEMTNSNFSKSYSSLKAEARAVFDKGVDRHKQTNPEGVGTIPLKMDKSILPQHQASKRVENDGGFFLRFVFNFIFFLLVAVFGLYYFLSYRK